MCTKRCGAENRKWAIKVLSSCACVECAKSQRGVGKSRAIAIDNYCWNYAHAHAHARASTFFLCLTHSLIFLRVLVIIWHLCLLQNFHKKTSPLCPKYLPESECGDFLFAYQISSIRNGIIDFRTEIMIMSFCESSLLFFESIWHFIILQLTL